ncbi:DUF2382 domain-containing protein [Deinococcus metallilatus]|uniref:DUF2382 domain-containing protein n=1 Tax=Deinococcus metallilatus TaxID=1211322 RepID=A0AAJ5F611_9DEIO|nr:DUF2382 domain-containing protein [Deinococcus metallilatus]MBB5294617.1 uncharacterized protein (TIGR02271 family) [Deinococcus metallilatus]QBY07655.1 DUF2382 domain-containing protein [Deinococcus metallilatus]RXJ14071.1 DUF2382 domain-containing protein [Deinococcus metallilatus]TLK30036.1 DUF2382 domain-containing protein [Deinococcus metallilatus]GMA15830.1 hypothetical protein GCM10025871_21610 [Deinococcus metallilatus]
MTHLHRLSDRWSDVSNAYREDFQDTQIYSPIGAPAYLTGQRQIGTVRDALVDDDYGKIRYLIVDDDGGSLNGALLIPIGYARIEDDGVYFDGLTSAQLDALHRYSDDEDYTFDLQSQDERMLRGNTAAGDMGTAATGVAATGAAATEALATGAYDYRDNDANDQMFKTPERLQLLEERLRVDKERYQAGSVEIGKHVETRQETVNVPVQREEVIIERHPVTDARPVEGDVLSNSQSETVRVDLEAERPTVSKQAFVTEEVEVGKRTVTETQTVTDTVGREVLDVQQTGDVQVTRDQDDRRDNRS